MYYKETLMGEKEGKSKGDEEKKLSAILERYDALLPKVASRFSVYGRFYLVYPS